MPLPVTVETPEQYNAARSYLLRELRLAMQDLRTAERMAKQGRQRILDLTKLVGGN